MLIIGLTGSIGMGKSATAGMFRAHGVPVHDADAAVHRLYAGAAVAPIAAAFPGVVTNAAVDRTRLSEQVVADPEALQRLEAIVHPLVREDQAAFLAEQERRGAAIALLDVPLLFESGMAGEVDVIVVVTAAPEIQRQRVLARPDMSAEKLAALLAQQLPDDEKRRRAHFLIDTGHGLAAASRRVEAILRALGAG